MVTVIGWKDIHSELSINIDMVQQSTMPVGGATDNLLQSMMSE